MTQQSTSSRCGPQMSLQRNLLFVAPVSENIAFGDEKAEQDKNPPELYGTSSVGRGSENRHSLGYVPHRLHLVPSVRFRIDFISEANLNEHPSNNQT